MALKAAVRSTNTFMYIFYFLTSSKCIESVNKVKKKTKINVATTNEQRFVTLHIYLAFEASVYCVKNKIHAQKDKVDANDVRNQCFRLRRIYGMENINFS